MKKRQERRSSSELTKRKRKRKGKENIILEFRRKRRRIQKSQGQIIWKDFLRNHVIKLTTMRFMSIRLPK
jgi:hypothetical protein